MAYQSHNYMKQVQHIASVYSSVKHYDVPDTFIVRHIFPKHHIFISYSKWKNIKAIIFNEPAPIRQQLSLF